MAANTLTEAAIVDAALELIRRSGVDALSMRALSRELGVSPMAAYYYVRTKQELLDLVAGQALSDVIPPASSEDPWPVRLRSLIDRIDATLRHHRGIGELLLDRMHSTQQHVLRAVMEILVDAGFNDVEVTQAYALIHTYLFGRYRVAMVPLEPAGVSSLDDDDIVSRSGVIARALHGQDFYDFGVDTLIRGLQSRAQSRAEFGAESNRPRPCTPVSARAPGRTST
jgi:TetR/AcrR family transcriptional regulator, tetracycline repressor protein